MSRLRNPIYLSGVQEKYVYLDTPDTALRLKEMQERMEAALEASRRIPIDREVIKEVQVESPELLERLNTTLKELGAIKMDISKGGNLRMLRGNLERFENSADPEKIAEVKPVQVTRIVRVSVVNKKQLISAVIIGAISWHLVILLGRSTGLFLM